MIPPGMPPEMQLGYDRTAKWSVPYYQRWAARVHAEMEAERRAGVPSDDMLNDLSDDEDGYDGHVGTVATPTALRRHCPTPTSMPSSPVMASVPRPSTATGGRPFDVITHHNRQRYSGKDGYGSSPVGVAGRELVAMFRGASRKRRISGKTSAGISSNNNNNRNGRNTGIATQTRSRSGRTTRSHSTSKTQFFELPPAQAFHRRGTKDGAFDYVRVSSHSDSSGLRRIHGGKISKRHH